MKNQIGLTILKFPLTRIIIGVVIIVAAFSLSQNLIGKLLYQASLGREFFYLTKSTIPTVLVVFVYILLFRFYERRKVTELSFNRISRYFTLGVLLGVVLQSLTILVVYLKGGFIVESVNSLRFIIIGLATALSTAIFEEILLRGIIFRIIEEKLGSYIALIISALIFGLLHLTNPNSSLLTALGIATQAGLLLGIAYILTRNLWFPIAIHFAWNFTQSTIFGANISGYSTNESLFTTKISGAEWFTGGEFGPEGSIQATLFCLSAAIVLFILCHKYDRMIKPFWKIK